MCGRDSLGCRKLKIMQHKASCRVTMACLASRYFLQPTICRVLQLPRFHPIFPSKFLAAEIIF
jgi:hypothetical protein